MTDATATDAHALKDVKQLGLFASIASLSYVFWVVGGMEMVERLAYYGVRAVAGLYATDAKSNGGLGVTAGDLAVIFLVWALFQAFIPVLFGGISDRIGYKKTIFISTVVKIGGYIIMGLYPTFIGFTVGAMVLATGTGIFKPGIQGTLVKATNRQNSSMAWGVFYQTVNIGGWIGPLLAAYLRQSFSWQMVFFVCAIIISCNFLLLLTYKEPDLEERLEHQRKIANGEIKQKNLVVDSLQELFKPHLFVFLMIMSGFWFMFNAFFDVLPLHIRDWVDTSTIVTSLFGSNGTANSTWIFLLGLNQDGMRFQPEGLININAGMIMLTCFLFAQMSSKFKAVNSIILGTLFQGLAFVAFGYTTFAWISLFCVVLFSSGEMMSSPKFLEFIGNMAPNNKKAMYLGFSQLAQAFGWISESYIAPVLYGRFADKDMLSRRTLAEEGLTAEEIDSVPIGEAFTKLIEISGRSAESLTQVMYEANNIGFIWYLMAGVAFVTAIGLYIYGKWVMTLVRS